jgi:hypothetical protein
MNGSELGHVLIALVRKKRYSYTETRRRINSGSRTLHAVLAVRVTTKSLKGKSPKCDITIILSGHRRSLSRTLSKPKIAWMQTRVMYIYILTYVPSLVSNLRNSELTDSAALPSKQGYIMPTLKQCFKNDVH